MIYHVSQTNRSIKPLPYVAFIFIVLTYTPNLHTLTLSSVKQNFPSSATWIHSIFEPLLDLKGDQDSRYPLQRLNIHLDFAHNDTQWDEWVHVDALLAKPQFALLEMVNIVLFDVSPSDSFSSTAAVLLNSKLCLLKASGKLRVRSAILANDVASDYLKLKWGCILC